MTPPVKREKAAAATATAPKPPLPPPRRRRSSNTTTSATTARRRGGRVSEAEARRMAVEAVQAAIHSHAQDYDTLAAAVSSGAMPFVPSGGSGAGDNNAAAGSGSNTTTTKAWPALALTTVPDVAAEVASARAFFDAAAAKAFEPISAVALRAATVRAGWAHEQAAVAAASSAAAVKEEEEGSARVAARSRASRS
jgi:hypothetical protein